MQGEQTQATIVVQATQAGTRVGFDVATQFGQFGGAEAGRIGLERVADDAQLFDVAGLARRKQRSDLVAGPLHEHADHLGGVVGLNKRDLLGKVLFNPQQLPGNRWTNMLTWPSPPLPAAAITGTAPVAVAPGVVVIPAASHTEGSQMVFVRLADGRELLFTGDIATMAQNWQELRARSRLIGEHFAPEDRTQVFAWLKTIRALKAQAPGLVILTGHDFEWLIRPENRDKVRFGFDLATD